MAWPTASRSFVDNNGVLLVPGRPAHRIGGGWRLFIRRIRVCRAPFRSASIRELPTRPLIFVPLPYWAADLPRPSWSQENFVENVLPNTVYRSKGLIWMNGFKQLVLFQLAGRRTNHFEVLPLPPEMKPCTRLVFIGQGVKQCEGTLIDGLKKCCIGAGEIPVPTAGPVRRVRPINSSKSRVESPHVPRRPSDDARGAFKKLRSSQVL